MAAMDNRPTKASVVVRGALSAGLIVAWLLFVIYHTTTWWERFDLWQNLVLLLASLIVVSMLNNLLFPERWGEEWSREHGWRWEQRRKQDAGSTEPRPPFEGPPRMPEGLHPRIAASIVAGLGAAVALMLYAAFLWPQFTLGQNLAVIAAGTLVLVGVMAAVWVPWGLRFAEMNGVWGEPDASRPNPPRP